MQIKTPLAVIGAASVLVLAGNTIALAATGQALLLGKSNSANTYTSITRTTAGSVLNLKSSSSSSAPLSVNGKGKVTNLNADLLDGLSASSLQNKVYRYRLPASSGTSTYIWDLPGLPSGTYLAAYTVYTQTDAITGQCYLQGPAGTSFELVSDEAGGATSSSWNAAGLFTASGGANLVCAAGAPWAVNTSDDGPTEVTFTRIDSATTGTGTILGP